MACSAEYIQFITSQLEGTGVVRTRKMFGDYCIYVDEKPVLLACDGITYIKKHEAIASLMADAEVGFPYDGAKEHYILNMEHCDHVRSVVTTLLPYLPYPKPKKKK